MSKVTYDNDDDDDDDDDFYRATWNPDAV